MFTACGTRPDLDIDSSEFLPEYRKPHEKEFKNFEIVAHQCLEILAREVNYYSKIEAMKEMFSKGLDKNSLANLYLSIDCDKKGFITYENFTSWIGKKKQIQLTKLEWSNLLWRLGMSRLSKQTAPSKMLFVDLFDLVFPLSYLGEYRIIGSTSAQYDSKFKLFLGSMNHYLEKQQRFTKQSGASGTESDQGQNFQFHTGSNSQQLQETLGILELKYEGMSDVDEENEGSFKTSKDLGAIFTFYHDVDKESFKKPHLKGQSDSLVRKKHKYDSEFHNKEKSFPDQFQVDLPSGTEHNGEGYFTEQFNSEKSDKVNCLWEINLPRSKESSGHNSRQVVSPKFHTNSENFHPEGIPLGLCLDDYEEIIESFPFLLGREIKPRARSLLESSAQQSIFN